MKKLISSVLMAAVLSQTAVFATEVEKTYKYTNFLNTEVAELATLVETCEKKGIVPEYELASYNILSWYVSEGFMLSDEKKMLECEGDTELLCGKSCTEYECELRDILTYNENALTTMYNEVKENLLAYINGTKTPEETDAKYDMSKLYVDDGILRDKNEKAVFSVGYTSTLSTKWNLTTMSKMGATNAVVEKPLSMMYTKNVAKDWVTQTDGTGGLCTYTKETTGENSVIKIVKTSEDGSFGIRQTVSVEAGSSYTFAVCVMGTNVEHAKMNIYDSDTHQWKYGKDVSSGTFNDEWKEVEVTFTPDSSAIDVEFLLYGTADELYIDYASVVKAGTNVNVISNPGFEEDATTNFNKYWFKSVLNSLKEAKEGKTTVSFMLSPHYFPILEGYENDQTLYAKDDNGNWQTGEFIKFNINHPKAKEVVEDYLRTVGQLLRDDPNVSALSNIILTNESAFNVRNFEGFYLTGYQEYLKDLYNDDIKALNKKWGTRYFSFANVTSIRNWCGGNYCREYDAIRYNEDVFTKWHKWMADILKEYLPDVMISAKVMSYVDLEDNPYWQLGKGASLEKFNTFSDLAGNDAYTFSSYTKPVDKNSFVFKMMWYDFLYSITGKPSYNSEDHIIAEGDNRYSHEMKNIVRADLWQGALHGRGMSSIWDFSTHDYNDINDTDSTNNYMFSTRPDVMETVAHTGLDLRKYGDLIERFNTKTPDVAIFYSKSSRMHVNSDSTEINEGDNPGAEYLRQMFNAYKGAIFAGAKVGFVSEDEPEKLAGYNILIVPAAEHITDNALAKIREFMEKGGTVVLAGNCFIYDEYHNKREDSLSGAVRITVQDENEYRECVSQLLDKDAMRVLVKKNATSVSSDNVEWSYYADNGKIYVNLMNYGDEEEVSVYINSERLNDGIDLLSREKVGDSFAIGNFEPMLLEFDLPEYVMDDGNSSIYDFCVADDGKITWEVSESLYYTGVEVYEVTSAGLTKLCDISAKKSFLGTAGKTYEIRQKGEAKGTRITVGDENTFSISVKEPERTGGYYNVTVSNENVNPAHGIVTMTVEDEEGNVYKVNSVEFTARKNETREIVFFAGTKASSVEFTVYDNKHSKKLLSKNIEYTK